MKRGAVWRSRWARGVLWGSVVLLVSVLLVSLHELLLSAALFLRMEQGHGAPAWLVRYGEHAVVEAPFRLPSGAPATLYVPRQARGKAGLVLAHGIHEQGIQERRLIGFARALASRGLFVLTPQLPELARYKLSYRTVEQIGAAARALAQHLQVEQVTLFGISFGGGLSIRAACDPAWAPHIERVIALGAHHDVQRVASFFLGDDVRGPRGERPEVQAHPYGLKVLFQSLLDEAQRGRLAAEKAARLRKALAQQAPELRRVSPAHCPGKLPVPLHLVHGLGDRVVPYTETLWNAQRFAGGSGLDVLVTSAIAHAEYAPPGLWERLRLVNFMAKATR